LNSIWFGRGEQLKLKAFRLAEKMLMWPESGIQAINKAWLFVLQRFQRRLRKVAALE
jgi:hypothetical protein